MLYMIGDSKIKSTMDTLSPQDRSHIMSLVRSKDTKPELVARRLIHRMGYRFRLHRSDLPGTPDLVFPSRNAVIFVNGCFWHRHNCSKGKRLPKTRNTWWRRKLEGNKKRDRSQHRQLRRLGWRVMVIWECQIMDKKLPALEKRIVRFLDG